MLPVIGFSLKTIAVIGFLLVPLFAQNPLEKKIFDKDGLKFEYPGAWTLEDRSTADTQYLLLGKNDSLLIVAIISPRSLVKTFDTLEKVEGQVRRDFLDPIEDMIKPAGAASAKADACLDLNGRMVAGSKALGSYKSQSVALEIYPTALGQRFVGLAYLSAVANEKDNDKHWKSLISSVSVSGSNRDPGELWLLNGGVLNGKALSLVRPKYPSGVGRRIATVVVAVTIDEKGKVVEAKAITGEGSFRSEAVSAARYSKFPPTLVCGQPVRITGTIFYNFSP